MRLLFLGDVYGKPGRKAVKLFMPAFLEETPIDICIANVDNLADGKGITDKTIKEMQEIGISLFTSGNHLYDRKEGLICLDNQRVVRPLNYPIASPGKTYLIETINKNELMLLSLCGQSFMQPVDSPFRVLDHFLETNDHKPKCILVDFHAESTAEKKSFAYYFCGRVSAILGTHTHIQTADEEIINETTAYITDVGMCGAHDSVIGITKESALQRIITGVPIAHVTAEDGLQVNAVVVEIDDQTGKALKIQRIKKYI